MLWRRGCESIFKLLLDSGKADIESSDDDGRTPLSQAGTNGHESVVELLRSTVPKESS
jgi:ankyrin repeat protein